MTTPEPIHAKALALLLRDADYAEHKAATSHERAAELQEQADRYRKNAALDTADAAACRRAAEALR